MKWLLLIILFCITGTASAQDSLNAEKRKNQYYFKPKPVQIIPFNRSDSTPGKRIYYYRYRNNIPNVITSKLPSPKKVGNNGKGHDVYTLPIDNMPMVRPDSSFHSNMPTGISRNK